MALFSHIISGIVALSLAASPAAALSQTSTTTPVRSVSSSSNNGSAVGTAVAVGVGVGAAALIGSQIVATKVLLKSFGGRVVTVIPCNLAGVPMLHITIVPSGIFPISYIWTPATITKLYGPPIAPGQQLVGLADAPLTCFVGVGGLFSAPIPLFGWRMTTVGTSLPGAAIIP